MAEINTRILDERINHVLDERRSRGGSDDGTGSWEPRVEVLERAVQEIKESLARIDAKIDQLPRATEISELKGRVSQLPTIWQLFGLMIAIFGMAFALIRLGLPRA